MALTQIRCADCGGKNVEGYRTYTIKDGEQRTMYHCASCGCSFSETKQTPLAHLKTPISVIVQVLSALTEGIGINAATRLYGVSKNSIPNVRLLLLSGRNQTIQIQRLTSEFKI